MTTYTHITNQGEAHVSGLTAVEAAVARLTYDGARYELRQDVDGMWTVYGVGLGGVFRPCYDGPAPWGRMLNSFAATEAEALAELALRIILADWNDDREYVMTDDEYQALRDAAQGEEDDE